MKIILLALCLVPSISSAALNTFYSNQAIKATEVNENFSKVKKIKYLATLVPNIPQTNNRPMGPVTMTNPSLIDTLGDVSILSGNIMGIKSTIEAKGKYLIKAIMHQSYYNSVGTDRSGEGLAKFVIKNNSSQLIKESTTISMYESGYQINSGAIHQFTLSTIVEIPSDNYPLNIELHYQSYGRNSNGTLYTTASPILYLGLNVINWEIERVAE